MYELHGHRCARITKSLRWLTRVLPVFDGSTNPEEFSATFSEQIPDSQTWEPLDSAFCATTARWRDNHKKYIPSWEACQKSLRLRFVVQLQEVRSRFDGQSGLQEHLEHCYEAWKHVPRRAHRLIHIQAPVAENWYTEVEPRHANRSGDKEITKYQPVGSKLTPWSRNLSGYAEVQYGVDGPYYDAAADLEALQPKS